MKTLEAAGAIVSAGLALLVTCCASSQNTAPQSATNSPQPVVPGTEPDPGVPSEQAVADADVVTRLSAARCDRSQSCDRVGPGAEYHDREDCMDHMRALVGKELNASRCPGGIGEIGLSRCVKSLRLGECDMPGQVYTTAAHCKLADMCLK